MNTTKKIKVLIAEDDYLVSQEIERTLRKMGYEVLGIAPNGEKAVEMTARLIPDIVLMDIKMPQMNGLEASRLIQQTCPTPVVALTAHESSDLIEEASRSGIGAYITKPPQPEHIERAITIALARHNDLMQSWKLIGELEENKKKLNEMIVTKDRFISILAHDLRNPVSALMNFSEQIMLRAQDNSKEELVSFLAIIHDTSRSLFELLENLLLWTRLQSGTLKAVPEGLNLEEVIRHCIRIESLQASSKSIAINLQIPENIVVKADRRMLETVLRNLVSNGIKFTPTGGKIDIKVEPGKTDILISVSDTGVGIPAGILNKLFRVDQEVSIPGTMGEKGSGLGLILCKELIEKSNGTISIESVPNEGTTVKFSLPKEDLESR